MPRPDPAQWPGLLEPAISYALVTVQAVTPELLPQPTPCQSWDVGMLLRHATESLAALQEGIDAGRIGLGPGPDEEAGDPAALFRDRAGRFLSAWTRIAQTPQTGAGRTETTQTGTDRAETARTGTDDCPEIIAIADRRLTLGLMSGVGALEMAVHGWDLSQACGHCQPIPGPLAIGLLHISPLLIPRTGRAPLFGPPVTVPPMATPSDHLVAYLGRNPG
jgi:uncharacterized protein (TIGR03083 family)